MVRYRLPPLQKHAIDPLSAMAAHVGVNAALKGLSKTEMGRRMENRQMGAGIQHGAAGREIHPAARAAVQFGVAPEVLAPYQAGSFIGGQTQGMSAHHRKRYLKKLRKNVAMLPELQQAPLGRNLIGATTAALQGKTGLVGRLPTVPQGQRMGRAAQGLLGAAAGGATLLHPEAAGHLLINTARKKFVESGIGRSVLAQQVGEGFLGKPFHPVARAGAQFGLSPGATYPRDLGQAVAQIPAKDRYATSLAGQFTRKAHLAPDLLRNLQALPGAPGALMEAARRKATGKAHEAAYMVGAVGTHLATTPIRRAASRFASRRPPPIR